MRPQEETPIRQQHRPYRWLPILIAAITVITLGIGSLALHRIETRLLTTTGESLALLAADIADKLDHVLFERYGDAQMMADTFAVKMHDAAALTQYLNRMKERYLLYRWLGVTDARGRMIASTDPASVGQDQHGAVWFQAVRDGKGLHLLDVSESPETGGSPAIGFSAPITGPDGTVLGVVTTRVGLRELEDVFGRTISAFQTLRGNRARIEWQFLMRDGTLAADSLLREEGKTNLKQHGLPSALLSGASEPGYVEELHTRRRVPVITGYARTEGYGEFPGFHWGILVRVDRSEILAPIRSMVWQLGLAGSVVLGPLIGLLLWTTRRVQKEWANSAGQLSRLKGLHTVSQALQQETSSPNADFALIQFLQLLVDTATQVTGARYGAFGLFDETGKHLIQFITAGMDQATQQTIGTSPTGRGLLGFLAQEADVLRLKDLTRHPTFTGFPPHHPPMRSFLGVSVRAHNRVFGRLYLTEKCGAGEFTEIDEEVIASLAAQAGIAIENGYFLNQIRAAEVQYRTTMAALPVAVVRLDQRNTVRFANRLFHEFIQRNETDTVGQSIDTLLPYAELTTLLHAVRTRKPPASQEHECLSPLPGMTHCRLIASPIRETNEVILVIMDTSAQKQAEETLRESERRHRSLMATMPGAAYEFCIDAAGRRSMPFISEGVVDLMGLSSAEIVADVEVAFHLVPAGALPALEQSIRDSLESLSPWLHDFPIRTTTGADKWLRGHSIPRREEDGATYWTGVLIDITERKRAEHALLQSRAVLQAFVEHAPASVAMLDKGLRYVAVSKRWLHDYHLGEQNLIGRHHYDVFPEIRQREDWQEIHRRCLDGATEQCEEDLFIRADGSQDWLRWEVRPWQDESGQTGGIIIFAEIITERKRAAEALRESQKRYQDLIANVDGIVWEADARTFQFTFVSQQAERLLGYPLERWLTEPNFWKEHLHPDDRDWAVEFCGNAAGERRDHDFEYRMLTVNGEILWLRDIVSVVVEDGQAVKIRGIMIDVTERKRAEKAFRSLVEGTAGSVGAEFFRSLVRQLAVALNVRYALVAEYTNEACDRARTIAIWGGTDFLDNVEYSLAGTPCEGHLGATQWFYPRGLRQRFPSIEMLATLGAESYLGTSLRDTTGRALGLLVVMDTAPMPEDELSKSLLKIFGARAAAELERKKAEEALKTNEEQLRQAQKMEAVGRLAGGIAHDFNNLLMVMIGYSTALLRRLEEDHPLRRYPLEIKKASDRAASLTHQLLAFSRQQALAPKLLDLNDSVTSMSEMLQRLIGEHIELVTSLHMGLGCVKADPGQIEQVIMNLVINARDAMPEGGTLTLTTDAVDIDEALANALGGAPPGSYIALAVSDTGHGMDPDTQAHIFEPFFTTKEKGKGTGLGLASVYGIVRQSGGSITVKSAPALGTTFTVYLPRVGNSAALTNEWEPIRESTGGSETILLVEDEEVVRMLVREPLEEAGYRILEARNGTEALTLSNHHAGPIHLLLTDVVMPHISGRELADRIIGARPTIKILYMSGYADDALGHRGILDPGTHFLYKPIAPEALKRKVRDVLDAQQHE